MRTSLMGLAALALGVSTAGQAHHAINAQFDVANPVTMTGTLVRLDNLNPHAYWRFEIKGKSGQVEKWSLESLAPAGLRRAGLRVKEDVKPGQVYQMKVYPSRNGTNTALMTAIIIGGKEYQFAAR